MQIFFGTWPIVGKIALRTLPSTGLVALRVAGATLAFLCLRRLTARPRITQRSDYARLALYSLLGVVLNQFLYVKGLALSTVINATILSTTILDGDPSGRHPPGRPDGEHRFEDVALDRAGDGYRHR